MRHGDELGSSESEYALFVAVCRLGLRAQQCHSLKEKRSVVRKLKERTRTRFHLGICEVGGQDTWQRIALGFALVGTDRPKLEALVTDVVRFIEGMGLAELVGEERDVLTYGDAPEGMAGAWPGRATGAMPGNIHDAMDDDESWIPEAWKSEDMEPEDS